MNIFRLAGTIFITLGCMFILASMVDGANWIVRTLIGLTGMVMVLVGIISWKESTS